MDSLLPMYTLLLRSWYEEYPLVWVPLLLLATIPASVAEADPPLPAGVGLLMGKPRITVGVGVEGGGVGVGSCSSSCC